MKIKDHLECRITTDFGNWNDIWEEVENDKSFEESTGIQDQIYEPIEEVQLEAASYLLGRW